MYKKAASSLGDQIGRYSPLMMIGYGHVVLYHSPTHSITSYWNLYLLMCCHTHIVVSLSLT